jgi:UDP-hydrolysing UDP-N-acetyl-D-glucosamine 2-epimerase
VKRIGVVTVARSDYGYYLPVLRRMQEVGLTPELVVAGMHLAPEFGLTVKDIEADGFRIADRVELLLSADTPSGVAKSIGVGVIGFAQAFARLEADILLLLGDRFEMFAAAVAALPRALPIAHIAGGESTEGAIDEAIRHSITKMSHLHFVSTAAYGERVIQMGEEPWRVVVTGAPTLDNLRTLQLYSASELATRTGYRLDPAPLLVTFHPATLEFTRTLDQLRELLAALRNLGLPVVLTYPNADTMGREFIREIERFRDSTEGVHLVANLGTRGYFSLMKHAAAMVGNSSSGIIEAASFELPVVDIGDRQKGRVRGANVLHAPCERAAIEAAVRRAVAPEFRRALSGMENPYGTGHAAEKIVETLRTVPLDGLVKKTFHDLRRSDR